MVGLAEQDYFVWAVNEHGRPVARMLGPFKDRGQAEASGARMEEDRREFARRTGRATSWRTEVRGELPEGNKSILTMLATALVCKALRDMVEGRTT